MSRRNEEWTCPRCGKTVPAQYPAMSRLDNKTEICSPCGTEEAMEDWHGTITPIDNWPVERKT